MSFLTTMLLTFFGDFINDIISKIGYAMTDIYTYTVEANQTSGVAIVVTLTTLLGASLSGFVVVKHLLGTYGLGTEGDPDQDPVEILFRLCKALGMMGINSWLFTEVLKLSNAVGKDVTTALLNGNADLSSTFFEKILTAVAVAVASPFLMIILVVVIVCVMVYLVSATYRGAELTLNKILFPIFCLDIISSNSERWNMFVFQYGISFFSYIIQMFCFNNFMVKFIELELGNIDIRKMFVTIGWLLLSIKGPKTLEKYIYATGAGRSIGQGASRLGQVMMNVGMMVR